MYVCVDARACVCVCVCVRVSVRVCVFVCVRVCVGFAILVRTKCRHKDAKKPEIFDFVRTFGRSSQGK